MAHSSLVRRSKTRGARRRRKRNTPKACATCAIPPSAPSCAVRATSAAPRRAAWSRIPCTPPDIRCWARSRSQPTAAPNRNTGTTRKTYRSSKINATSSRTCTISTTPPSRIRAWFSPAPLLHYGSRRVWSPAARLRATSGPNYSRLPYFNRWWRREIALATKVARLAHTDCASCHHELRVPSWRAERGYGLTLLDGTFQRGKPGRPQPRLWSLPLCEIAVSPADAKTVNGALTNLHAACDGQPFGDIDVVAKSTAAARQCRRSKQKPAPRRFDEAAARTC